MGGRDVVACEFTTVGGTHGICETHNAPAIRDRGEWLCAYEDNMMYASAWAEDREEQREFEKDDASAG
jgi:hypothetical protein